jgi:hypothetical protein
VQDLRGRYQSAKPFPHIVLDDFLTPDIAHRAMREFPQLDRERWINWVHVNERKYGNTDPRTWGPTLRAVVHELNSPAFVRFLGQLTGIDDLLVDNSLEGGGLHQSTTGGFLNVHADFTVHPHNFHWRRRVNLLLYLNADWPPRYGGDLELWSRDMKSCESKIAPLANRAVIFNTDKTSFHGHPTPLRCPPGEARQSIALYYFTEEDSPLVRSTEYRSRPGEGPRAALIFLDKHILRLYDRAKRELGLSDQAVSRVLRSIERLRPRIKRQQDTAPRRPRRP